MASHNVALNLSCPCTEMSAWWWLLVTATCSKLYIIEYIVVFWLNDFSVSLLEKLIEMSSGYKLRGSMNGKIRQFSCPLIFCPSVTDLSRINSNDISRSIYWCKQYITIMNLQKSVRFTVTDISCNISVAPTALVRLLSISSEYAVMLPW